MSFTVKSVFPKLDLPEEVINKHRMAVGMRVRDSWNNRYESPPSKIVEDGFQVNSYSEEFKDRAMTVINRYLAELSQPPSRSISESPDPPIVEPKRKRPRINSQRESVKRV